MASTRAVIGRRGGVAQGGVAHERVDRGQPGVAGADAVAALGLEVVEEVQHERRVEVGQSERGGWSSGALLGEAQQQLERVAVGLDGAGAGAALGDQAPQEEVLHQLREPDLRRSHGAPAGSWSAKCSNRWATMLISSGTADRYQ